MSLTAQAGLKESEWKMDLKASKHPIYFIYITHNKLYN